MNTRVDGDRRFDLTYGEEWTVTQDRGFLVLGLAGQSYALPIEPVEQIIEMVTITPLPQDSPRVEGVINVRGAMVPVVDLGALLGLPPTSLGLYTPIVLVWNRGHRVGLIVDGVYDVVHLPCDQVVHPDDFLPADLNSVSLLSGVIRRPDTTILILDLDRVLRAEKVDLAHVLDYLANLSPAARQLAESAVEGGEE